MERLLLAECSSDLSEAKDNGFSDVDWLRAAGAVGQHHSLALSIWRVSVVGEYRYLRDVAAGLGDVARDLGLAEREIERAVVTVVEHLAAPACGACHGRGFAVLPGAPVLSDEACPACQGRGIRPLAGGAGAQALYDKVQGLQALAAGEISRKLRT